MSVLLRCSGCGRAGEGLATAVARGGGQPVSQTWRRARTVKALALSVLIFVACVAAVIVRRRGWTLTRSGTHDTRATAPPQARLVTAQVCRRRRGTASKGCSQRMSAQRRPSTLRADRSPNAGEDRDH